MEIAITKEQRDELIEALRDALDAEAERFNMDHWFALKNGGCLYFDEYLAVEAGLEDSVTGGYCQTILCIAGWVILLAWRKGILNPHNFQMGADGDDYEEIARKLLGLPDERLFHLAKWPHEINVEYFSARGKDAAQQRVEAGQKAITHFLAEARMEMMLR